MNTDKKQSYEQFRAQYKASLKGKSFNMGQLNKQWLAYKGKKTNDKKTTLSSETAKPNDDIQPSSVDAGKVEQSTSAPTQVQPVQNNETAKETLEVGRQSNVVLAPSAGQSVNGNSQPATTSPASPTQLVRSPNELNDKLYNDVADAVHQTAANLIKLFTEGAVEVQKNHVERLNTCGVHLLKKYDKDGKILEYSPEIAYMLTLADIGTQVYVEIKKKNSRTQQATQKMTPPAVQKMEQPPMENPQGFKKLLEA